MQLSGVSKEGAKLTPLLSELLIFHMCWAPAYGPPAEPTPPSSAKLILAPGALFESQKAPVVCWTGVFFGLLGFLGGGPERGWDAEMAPELQAEASSPSSPGRFVRHCW